MRGGLAGPAEVEDVLRHLRGLQEGETLAQQPHAADDRLSQGAEPEGRYLGEGVRVRVCEGA